MDNHGLDPRILSVGAGKGGVGKSTVAANLACLMADKGRRVILIDADLGGANLHLLLGIRYPEKTLNDFISGRLRRLEEAILPTFHSRLGVICGAAGILKLADPRYAQKKKLLSHLQALNTDLILVDVGAGSHANVTDFFALSDHGIVVVTPDSPSLENAYGFIKNHLFRKMILLCPGDPDLRARIEKLADPWESGVMTIPQILERLKQDSIEKITDIDNIIRKSNPRLIVNRVKTNGDIQVGKRFTEVVKRYLGLNMTYVGYIIEDEMCGQAIKKMVPALKLAPDHGALYSCFNSITENLLFLER